MNKRFNKISFFQTEKGKFAIIEAPCQETVLHQFVDDKRVAFGSVTTVNPHLDGGEYSYLLNFYNKDTNDYSKHIYNVNVCAPSYAMGFLSDLCDLYWMDNVSSVHSLNFVLSVFVHKYNAKKCIDKV